MSGATCGNRVATGIDSAPGYRSAHPVYTLKVAPQAGVKTEVTRYPLAQANEALADLRDGRLQGAAVLLP
jgi:D-arabinose 1-dehydrogenase-like Zn-dependent alcohol dehydrogenase